jgi:hypothetical protein
MYRTVIHPTYTPSPPRAVVWLNIEDGVSDLDLLSIGSWIHGVNKTC